MTTWALGSAFLVMASMAAAAPYSVTYDDLIVSQEGLPASINLGEQVSTTIVFDNGNTSAALQTWSADEVQCVIFRFNNAADRFVAINYVGASFLGETSGNFTTDAIGHLQAGTFSWTDSHLMPHNRYVTNITGTSEFDGWFLNGGHDVVYWNDDDTSLGFQNVANDDTVTNWSNPLSAAGVCASALQQAPAAEGVAVPAMDNRGIALLSLLLAGVAFAGLWRAPR